MDDVGAGAWDCCSPVGDSRKAQVGWEACFEVMALALSSWDSAGLWVWTVERCHSLGIGSTCMAVEVLRHGLVASGKLVQNEMLGPTVVESCRLGKRQVCCLDSGMADISEEDCWRGNGRVSSWHLRVGGKYFSVRPRPIPSFGIL